MTKVGDSVWVKTTAWSGMASGGITARTLLLVAYAKADVLGSEANGTKLRCPRVAVVALVDGERLLQEVGTRADLSEANLSEANLSRADLSRANLSEANLFGARRGDLTHG